MQVHKTVYISYQRANIYMAQAVYTKLLAKGYDVFLNYQALNSGEFAPSLLNQIAARAHLVVILTPSALGHCTSPEDGMRKEIEYAVEQKRNIIPLFFAGFDFEDVQHCLVSDALKLLPSYKGVVVPGAGDFDEAITQLYSADYLDKLLDIVIQPFPAQAIQAEAITAPTPNQIVAEELYEIGFCKLRLDDDYVAAIECYTLAIDLKPDFVEAYYRRGRAYMRTDDKKKGLQDWKKAVQLRPNDQRVNIIRATIANNEGDFELGLAEAETGLVRNPNYIDAYFQKGFALAAIGDLDRAIADYSEAIRLDPQRAVSEYNNRAILYRLKEQYDQAIADYDEAIRINPQNVLFYCGRGIVRYAQGNLDGAIADHNEAIRINPKSVEAYISRGDLRFDKKHYDQAIADYSEAARINPHSAEAYFGRGNVRMENKQYNQAIADFSAAIRANPQMALAYNNRGFAFVNKKQYAQALADFNEAIRLDPQFALAYRNRAHWCYRDKQYDYALADCNRAIQFNSQDADAYNLRGILRRQKRQYEQAKADWEIALQIDPNHKYAKRNLYPPLWFRIWRIIFFMMV